MEEENYIEIRYKGQSVRIAWTENWMNALPNARAALVEEMVRALKGPNQY